MGTIKDWLGKRKTYEIKFCLTAAELRVLKKALKAYTETATNKEKFVIEDLLGIIDYQESKKK